MNRMRPFRLLAHCSQLCKVVLPIGVGEIESLAHSETDVDIRVGSYGFPERHLREFRNSLREAELQVKEFDAEEIVRCSGHDRKFPEMTPNVGLKRPAVGRSA